VLLQHATGTTKDIAKGITTGSTIVGITNIGGAIALSVTNTVVIDREAYASTYL
jgi:hypothetical protein